MILIKGYEQAGSIYSMNGVLIGVVGSVETAKGSDVVKQAIDLKEAGFTADEIFKLLKKAEEEK